MLSKEKAYKDLGGITGSSLIKQEIKPRKKPKTDLNSKNNLPNNFFPFVGKPAG